MLALTAVLAPPSVVLHAQDGAVGRIKVASGAVFIVRNQEVLPASVGAVVLELDSLRTGADGRVGISWIRRSSTGRTSGSTSARSTCATCSPPRSTIHDRVFAGKHIRFDKIIDPDPCVVSGDPDRLRQVMDALLSNAAKFTPEGGVVEVRLRSAGTDVELAVSDSGIGISAGFLPHVFGRFRQQDDMTTRPDGGLGLGLVIVQQVVHMHGGAVTAASGGAHQGTTFTVRLPASPLLG